MVIVLPDEIVSGVTVAAVKFNVPRDAVPEVIVFPPTPKSPLI
jgi:hypothetical protein